MVNKRGDLKWDVLIALILGLLVLALSLFFIFQEYFTSEDLDWQNCRQSIVLRANLPEYKGTWIAATVSSFKDAYPLKCKTNVVEISEDDVDNLEEIIAQEMITCWALFDNGDTSAFPSSYYGYNSICVPCARIHLNEKAKEKIVRENKIIYLRDGALDRRVNDRDYNYWTYLNNSGKKFPAFNPASGKEFNYSGDEFKIDNYGVRQDSITIYNRLTGASAVGMEYSDLSLPKILDPTKGDLIINYGVLVYSGKDLAAFQGGDFGDYIPYLFYFQNGQNSDPFVEVKKNYFDVSWDPIYGAKFCNSWEGIPA